MPIPNNRYSAKKGKQTGTLNKKTIGQKQRKTNTVDPWGPIVPNRRIGRVNSIGQSVRSMLNSTRGSATRKPKPAPELFKMDYPANDPLAWPVEIDKVNHTRQPSVSGVNSTVITNVNKSIEHAYTRDGYQNSP